MCFFYNFVVAARVAEKKLHNVLGQVIEVHLVHAAPTANSFVPLITGPTIGPQITVSDTILVKGLKPCHTEAPLRLFFNNKKRCDGGGVTKIVLKKDKAYVTFADSRGKVAKYLNINMVAISVNRTLYQDSR